MNERLRFLRKQLGLSQDKFGSKIYLSQDHISSLESGRREITERTIKDICSEFNVSRDWFISGTGDMFMDITEELDYPDHIKDMLQKILELDKLNKDKSHTISKMAEVFLEEELAKVNKDD